MEEASGEHASAGWVAEEGGAARKSVLGLGDGGDRRAACGRADGRAGEGEHLAGEVGGWMWQGPCTAEVVSQAVT